MERRIRVVSVSKKVSICGEPARLIVYDVGGSKVLLLQKSGVRNRKMNSNFDKPGPYVSIPAANGSDVWDLVREGVIEPPKQTTETYHVCKLTEKVLEALKTGEEADENKDSALSPNQTTN